MKRYIITILASLIYTLGGCTYEPVSEEFETVNSSSELSVEQDNIHSAKRENSTLDPEYIYNEIIIRYKERISDKEKADIRRHHDVISYKECKCADERLELWRFKAGKDVEEIGEDQSIADIERRRAQAKADPGLEGTDFNFVVQMNDGWKEPSVARGIPEDKIATKNSGVTVAVLDTGLDYNYKGFQRPFIYNSIDSGTNVVDGRYMDTSGWDFVNQDNDPIDDNGHGTVITYLITSTLEKQGINDYQILPVKVADRDGRASFFDLLCGFKYALTKPDVTIINLSLGWYGESSHFLSGFITEALKRNILIITSAGNGSSNNDRIPHFPSSYSDENIISVAGMNRDMSSLASYSNYGKQSVDFAALSENIPFEVDGVKHLVSGTSFASAYATAHVALLRTKGILPGNVESYMASTMVYSKFLYDRIKTSAYIPHHSRIK